MTLLTCSDYNPEAFRLFSSFRKHHDDIILWLLSDCGEYTKEWLVKIEDYFGNMKIIYRKVDTDYWHNTQCLHKPQWDDILKVLKELPPKEEIIRCDTHDVVFQCRVNIPPLGYGEVIMCTENQRYEEAGVPQLEWWHKHYQEKYANEYIRNSGVLIATAGTLLKVAKEMVHTHYSGIYADQNLLHVVLDDLRFVVYDDITLATAAIRRELEKREDGYYYFDGIAPSIIHCAGRANDKRMYPILNDFCSWDDIKATVEVIAGEAR